MKNISDAGFIAFDEFYKKVNRFVTQEELRNFVQELEKREWIKMDDTAIKFTDLGIQEFAQMKRIQHGNWRKIMRRIKNEDYETTTKVLAQIVSNLQMPIRYERSF